MYKGYRVVEEIIKDYEYPQVDIVVQAPCGCLACEEYVQPGHTYCDAQPTRLVGDNNVTPVFSDNRWYWRYHGPHEFVDAWLTEQETM